MEARHVKQQCPDVSAEQRASNELVKRIRKLRWMGMEKEAERIQSQLATYRDPPADSVLAAPRDTD